MFPSLIIRTLPCLLLLAAMVMIPEEAGAQSTPGKPAVPASVRDTVPPSVDAPQREGLYKTTKTTEWIIDPKTGDIRPKVDKPRVPLKDTVIVLRPGLSEAEQKKRKEAALAERKKKQACDCLTMELQAPEKLRYSAYLNYGFLIRNQCEETLYVQSSGFQFAVFQSNGRSAKTLRSLQFSKQFKYPEWVAISPKEDFEFQFADDPFFRYELQSGEEYIFRFQYLQQQGGKQGKPPGDRACPHHSERKILIH